MSRARRRKLRRQAGSTGSERRVSETTRGGGLPHWALTGALVASAAVASPLPLLAQATGGAARAEGTATRSFSIPAGSLDGVLASFTRSTGINVVDPSDLARSASSPGVIGAFGEEVALRHLLVGTKVTYVFVNARTIRLERGDAPAPEQALYNVAGVTVTGIRQEVSSPKYSAPLRDIPQSIAIVPNAVIEAQGVTSLRDVVRNVPGLTVNAGEGGATPGDNFNIRGFSARNDLFVNGVRDVAGYSRETFNVEQVEVTKGPGSAYIGRGTTGGAVNLVTKTPHAERAMSASGGIGNGDFGRATVDVNEPLGGGLGLRLNGSWQHAGVADLDVVQNKSWGVAPSIAIGMNGHTRASLDYAHMRQDNIPAYGIQSNNTEGPPAGVDTHAFFGLRGLDFEKVESNQANLRIEHDFGARARLTNRTGWVSSDVHRIVTPVSTTGVRSPKSHVTDDENLTNATDLALDVRTGPVSHAITAGVELTREESHFGNYKINGTLPNANLANPSADAFTGTYQQQKFRRNVVAHSEGVYVFDTARLNRYVQLTGGLRQDYFSPTYRDSLGVVLEPKTDSDALTWRAGAVVKPIEEGSVYVAYGTSFNPTGELLAFDGAGASGVAPEKNTSVEVGTKWDLFKRRLGVTLALFRTRKTNARIPDPLDPSGPAILAGKQRADGAELGVTGQVGALNVFAGYTRLNSEIEVGTATTTGTPLPNTPKDAASVWGTYTLPVGLELGGGVRYVGERWLNTNGAVVPSYTAVDGEAGYTVNENLSFRVNLTNLTNATYYDSGRFWVPAAGRSLKLFATVRR